MAASPRLDGEKKDEESGPPAYLCCVIMLVGRFYDGPGAMNEPTRPTSTSQLFARFRRRHRVHQQKLLACLVVSSAAVVLLLSWYARSLVSISSLPTPLFTAEQLLIPLLR
jgi:hypothetical protein